MKKIERSKFYIVTACASLIAYLSALISVTVVESQWLFMGLILLGAMLALIANDAAGGWDVFGLVKDDPSPNLEELEEMIRKKMGK